MKGNNFDLVWGFAIGSLSVCKYENERTGSMIAYKWNGTPLLVSKRWYVVVRNRWVLDIRAGLCDSLYGTWYQTPRWWRKLWSIA